MDLNYFDKLQPVSSNFSLDTAQQGGPIKHWKHNFP